MINRRLWLTLLIIALSIFSLAALLPAEEKDVLKLRVYPSMGLPPLRNVLLMVEILQPERFWCPSIEVTWWEGNVSKWEEDCEPLAEGEIPENIYKTFRLGEKYAFTRTQEIEVLIKQGKHSKRGVVKITVAGEDQ